VEQSQVDVLVDGLDCDNRQLLREQRREAGKGLISKPN
jgi:hypothetical protein